ncbi:MAG: thiamine ABC transporter substrate-binding protein [Chloroflexi bacterium]|nr:thiamine ABC transporter substrate-binding protein [Chloroflexota bacterium]MBI3339046.1 thiamine ABC transporter substrate-binding protein [Chloroflexota bacterium]
MKRILYISLFVFLLSACAPKPSGPQTLTVMTHDSFAVSENVVQAFEQANNAKVTFIKSGDTGAALNKAILTKDAPLADVFYGVDNTFLSRALDADIYEPYDSPALKNIPAEFQLDPSRRALPVDYGDVCINYDKAYFASRNLPIPQSLEDLTKPEYKGLLVVENPATSSPGLAFLLATVKHFGDPNYLGYWKDLRANGLVVVDGWETAYYTNFSGSSGKGPQPMVVSYGTSPAAEVMFAQTPLSDSPTASIIGPDTCFRQIEFVGILKGTQRRALAEKFVDFALGAQFQADMPAQMFVYPVAPNITLPDAFVKYSQTAPQPAAISPADIAANRDAWIQNWTDAVLR